MTSNPDHLQVLMMPDYRADNPYQTLLAEGLETVAVKVAFPKGYRRVFPLFRAVQSSLVPIHVLHLHWTTPYLKGDSWLMRAIYSAKLILDLQLVQWSGTGIIWTIHNTISHDSKFPRLELWTQRLLVRLVDRIIVHNSSVVDGLSKLNWFHPSKAAVVPIGNYRSLYQPAIEPSQARQALNLSMEGRILLSFGMIRPYKGIEGLLDLWQQHQNLFQGHRLMIVGKAFDDAYGKELEQKAANLPGVIFRHEFIPDEQVHLYLSAADAVILPFTQILTSSSLILGMSYGKPVIAPRLGGVAETVGPADWFLYDPQDSQGLLHAVKDCLEADLKERAKVIEEICDRLSWNVIGQKTKDLYQAAAYFRD